MTKWMLFLLLLPFGAFSQVRDSLRVDTVAMDSLSMDSLSVDSVWVEPEYDIWKDLAQPGADSVAVTVHEKGKVQDLMRWRMAENKRRRGFTGYRIQLYSVNSFGCDVEKLKEYRNNFEELFRDIPAYLIYVDPDFKIRAGNFHSRLESIPVLHRIRKEFPSCYPVKTEITLQELKRVPMQDIVPEEDGMPVTGEDGGVE